jgi:hypothetical protein
MTDCSNCGSGTRIIHSGGFHYDCKAIRKMKKPVPNKKKCHKAHEVMTIPVIEQIMIPKCCPNPKVMSAQRIGDY